MTRKDQQERPTISGGETTRIIILERHDLAEDSTRQANLETACMLRHSSNHGTLLPDDDNDNDCYDATGHFVRFNEVNS